MSLHCIIHVLINMDEIKDNKRIREILQLCTVYVPHTNFLRVFHQIYMYMHVMSVFMETVLENLQYKN